MLWAIALYWMRSVVLPARFMPVVVANDDATPELSRSRMLNGALFELVELTRAASPPPTEYDPSPDSKLSLEMTVNTGPWQTGSAAQSLSAQSVAPSLSLSMPSLHTVSVVGPPPPFAALTVSVTPEYAANALIITK